VQPGGPVVIPRLHAVNPGALQVEEHFDLPAVESDSGLVHPVLRLHAVGRGQEQIDPEDVMTLFEYGRMERHHLAHEGFRRPVVVGLLGSEVPNRDAAHLWFVDIRHSSTVAAQQKNLSPLTPARPLVFLWERLQPRR